MPFWLSSLINFLKGFLPAFFKAKAREEARQGEIADKGAAEQRQAEVVSIDAAAEEARKRHDEIESLHGADLARRADPWMRPRP